MNQWTVLAQSQNLNPMIFITLLRGILFLPKNTCENGAIAAKTAVNTALTATTSKQVNSIKNKFFST